MDLSMFSLVEIAVAMVFSGLVVVFVALVGLWGIVAVCGWLFTLKKTRPSADTDKGAPASAPAHAPKASSAPAPTPVVEKDISSAVVAAISGAVAAMTQGRGAVTSVSLARESQNVSPAAGRSRRSAWAKAGVHQNLQPF